MICNKKRTFPSDAAVMSLLAVSSSLEGMMEGYMILNVREEIQ